MKLWADEDVTPTLQDVANARGYDGTSNRQRGKLNVLDHDLYPVVVKEEWVFITNNEKDFQKLAKAQGLHPGLIILPSGGSPQQQRDWLDNVITYIEQRAAEDDEPPEDWMVCRIVTYEKVGDTTDWEWLPEDAA
jgi:predicted nuclease of predicted toxin-antitoxin system